MQKGQAEALVPLIQTLLAETQTSLHKIGRIGVGLGPGNFTGIRISISLARGLGVSLGCPVIGVNSFEASIEDKAKETLCRRSWLWTWLRSWLSTWLCR